MGTALHRIELHTFLGTLNESSVVVDLGMSDGAFARDIVSKFGCLVFGLEAEPTLFAALQETPRVTTEHAAVAATNAPIALHLSRSQCASTEFAWSPSSVEVPGTTLAAFFDRHNLSKVDLVKMDIEGAEFDVLASTNDSDIMRIKQLTVEYHDFLDHTQLPRVMETDNRLRQLGFRRFKFTVFTNGDLLYVHPDIRLSMVDRLSILVRGKYLPGLRRSVGRLLLRLANSRTLRRAFT